MFLEIDFNSDEALYIQLRDRIIRGIAMEELREGDTLPSVRALAESIGINMHTVNKAYAVLREEGFLTLDRHRGAVIALDLDKLRALKEIDGALRVIIARAVCKRISREEIHQLIDEIMDDFGG